MDIGPSQKIQIHQFDITTWRKTATTACHVAGFLKEQAIPIPIPPILNLAFSSLHPVHHAQMSETSPGRAHPEPTAASL